MNILVENSMSYVITTAHVRQALIQLKQPFVQIIDPPREQSNDKSIHDLINGTAYISAASTGSLHEDGSNGTAPSS
jgi:hypothetical protein